jgi:hypothetical protein
VPSHGVWIIGASDSKSVRPSKSSEAFSTSQNLRFQDPWGATPTTAQSCITASNAVHCSFHACPYTPLHTAAVAAGWRRLRSLESAISRRDQGGCRGISSKPSAKRAFGRSQTSKRTCERIKKSCHSERSEESRPGSQPVPMVRAERDSSLRSE